MSDADSTGEMGQGSPVRDRYPTTRTLATPRNTRRMLLRMITPTRARLIWREITASRSCGTSTNGRKETMYASTKLTTSALVVDADSPGGERGRTRLTIDSTDGQCWLLSRFIMWHAHAQDAVHAVHCEQPPAPVEDAARDRPRKLGIRLPLPQPVQVPRHLVLERLQPGHFLRERRRFCKRCVELDSTSQPDTEDVPLLPWNVGSAR